MAEVYKFPTEKQRRRAGVEAVIRKGVNACEGLTTQQAEDLFREIMSTYDQHWAEWNVEISFGGPVDQPFTPEQVQAIQSGIGNASKMYEEIISNMFLEILTLKAQIFKLTKLEV